MSEARPLLAWSEFVYELQRLLRDKGVKTPLYIVGGAVRDAYKRAAITDIDIAVDGDAIKVARNVADWLDADIYIMDRERGVARVFVKRTSDTSGPILLDFARFRGASLYEDLVNRDFTVNALAADLLGDLSKLIDLLAGLQDLRAGVLRRCAPHAIEADPLRALRAVRQSTQLALKIHPDTLVDLRRYAGDLGRISPERIRDEFFKLLALDKAARSLRVLRHLDMLQYILPAFTGARQPRQPERQLKQSRRNLPVTERICDILTAISDKRTDNSAAAFDLGMMVMQLDRFRGNLQQRLHGAYGNGRRHQELLVLAALLCDLGGLDCENADEQLSDSAKAVATALRLTLQEGSYLSQALSSYPIILADADWSPLQRHRFWYRLKESGIDAILLAAATYLGRRGADMQQAEWLAFVETAVLLLDTWFNQYETVVNPPVLLDGDDIMRALGIKRGPKVGKLLSALREAQVLGIVRSEADARAFLARRQDEKS